MHGSAAAAAAVPMAEAPKQRYGAILGDETLRLGPVSEERRFAGSVSLSAAELVLVPGGVTLNGVESTRVEGTLEL